ncbi:hypothetical protein B0293_32035 [Amycolatopsis azurea DSM 43854]|uniref:Integral membrane protein n=1 Tax=Amycolatopsis azurea DSM 43854 TaxID=1238180 RepID=A0ABX3J5B9_9PSEU|nr:hypothetical protein B0293_32035 [Amycolatopsis azurea DSM 43854]
MKPFTPSSEREPKPSPHPVPSHSTRCCGGPAGDRTPTTTGTSRRAIILVIGLIVGIAVLTTIGAVLAVAGVVLAILGGTGRKVGGRAHWF